MIDNKQIEEALMWTNKVMNYFKPYKPEIKAMTINYRSLSASIEILLLVPDDMKRKFKNIEIPAYQGFVISDMRDACFNKIGNLWFKEDGKWKLNASGLPSSETYFLSLKGVIPKDALSKIVFVQPAANRDQTEDIDRYWLSSMIKNVGLLEKVWNILEVDDVTAKVNIGIERCFSMCLPKELKEQIDNQIRATKRFIQAGHSRNRDELSRAWSELHRAEGRVRFTPNDIFFMINRLTDNNTFSTFIYLDEPYSIGEIRREEIVRGAFPEKMYTEAVTSLNLKKPTASGYLSFKKKDYIDTVKKEFERLY